MFAPRVCAFVIAAGVLSASSAAWACSCGFEVPFEVISGPTVPQNGALLLESRNLPKVTATVGGDERDATVAHDTGDLFFVTFDKLAAGQKIELSARTDAGKETSGAFAVGKPIRPDQKLAMAMGDPRRGKIALAAPMTCARTIDAVYVDLEPKWSGQLAEYQQALVTRVDVDGKPSKVWTSSLCKPAGPSGSGLGRHKYRVWEGCKAEDHSVTKSIKLVATLPGTELSWEVEEQVEFACDKAKPADGPPPKVDGLPFPGDEEASAKETEEQDGKEKPAAPTEQPSKKSSCTTAPLGTPSPVMPALLLGGLFVFGARQRRSRQDD